MENGFVGWFVSFSLFLSLFINGFASGEWSGSQHAVLHGKLVKKYFRAPRVVKPPPFGWFVQLDSASQKKTAELFENLSEKERAFFGDIDLQCVRLMADKFAVREWAHDHFETQVTLEGEISEPDLFGEFSSFKFNPEEVTPAITEKEKSLACLALEENNWEPSSLNWTEGDLSDESLILPDDQPEKLVSMTGKLILNVLNSDPDRGAIECGGHPIYSWILKLDPKSFETACTTPVRASFQTPGTIRSFKHCDEMELTGDYDAEWLCEHLNQTVTVQGYLWHAHTGHHHTPVMMDVDPWFK
jgi:hypothetical protein